MESDPSTADWCGLPWTTWAPLDSRSVRSLAPKFPGLYRIRRAGANTPLTYIGQTGRTLRERLLSLSNGVHTDRCPFNDPHTAAPHLWLLSHLEGVELEFSCAPVEADRSILRGTEDMLLWRHRVEVGRSTEANYGRFFPGWSRPTNRQVRRAGVSRPGRAASRLDSASEASRYDTTEPALAGEGSILTAAWWLRSPLSEARQLPAQPALYCIYDAVAVESEPAYIGQTSSLAQRAVSHAASRWPMRAAWLAYRPLPTGTPKHVLHELESDLLGWYFWRNRCAPSCQYRSEEGRQTGAL